MRETRKALKAANIQLRGQLASTTHESRRSLNEHVGLLKARNLDLVKTIATMDTRIKSLEATPK